MFSYEQAFAYIKSSKVFKTKAQIVLFEQSIAKFKNDIGRYPENQEGLEVLRIRPDNINNWNGPYINKEIPLDYWGNKYIYFYPAKYGNKDYDIYSFGKNMSDDKGLNDDITNWKKINYQYYDEFYKLKHLFLYFLIIILIALFVYFLIAKKIIKIFSNIKRLKGG